MRQNNRTARRADSKGRFLGTTSEVREMVLDGSLRPGKWDAARLARFMDEDTYQGPQGEQFKLAVGSALNTLAKEELVNHGPKRGLYIVPGNEPQPQTEDIIPLAEDEEDDCKEVELPMGYVLELIGILTFGQLVARGEDNQLYEIDARPLDRTLGELYTP